MFEYIHYKFTSHIAAFLSVVLITEMLEICIQTSYDQNVQLILKSYLPVVYGTPLVAILISVREHHNGKQEWAIQKHWQHRSHTTKDADKQKTQNNTEN